MSVPQQSDSSAVTDVIMATARKYPIREFPGERRHPNTGWIIIDLVAINPLLPKRRIRRTFQARDLINDEVSVHLSALRTQSFFTEVYKLLVFCARLGNLNMLDWDDEVLNNLVCGLADQGAPITAFTDDTSLWDARDRLECGKVVELFERATEKGVDSLTIYVMWHDSRLSQEFSLLRKHFKNESFKETRFESLLDSQQESPQDLAQNPQ
ncbi:hypothetical protein DHEL01_v205636 [Diaporthe helianthi]|uniref:Uncharacterized protein n=1 Tax=Diaporthe helianthi TaxID=158607 RepID=A0A2P5I0F0_DIAHE|nr:hypothetical protein DHEL01_v205636 [Diaporthe helianthi]